MSQNEAVTPSVTVLSMTPNYMRAFWIAARNCYYKGKIEELNGEYDSKKAEDLFKKIINAGHDSCLEHINIQIAISGVSRSYMAQITRHRHVTFHISSQHFQNHADYLYVIPDFVNPKNKIIFEDAIKYLNEAYKKIIANGDKHYIARGVLPNATACKIIMTVNLRELRHIIKLRNSHENTPEMQKVTALLAGAINEIDTLLLWRVI
jgi:thymidylate synthase (FAD)